MNEISLLNNTSNQSSISGFGNTAMAKDEFLQLLVEQLKHQDPMSPMNSQDFASQLAQFSSLEQLTNMSGMMEESMKVDLMLTQAINNTMSTTFIGKTISAAGDKISLIKDTPVDATFQLNDHAESVTVNILNNAGKIVKDFELGYTSKGKHTVSWDGKDSNGNSMPEGNYTMQVKAVDSDGNTVDSVTMVKGLITGIKYTEGSAVFVVDDEEIPFNQVLEINSSDQ